jgi:hypothetical protein
VSDEEAGAGGGGSAAPRAAGLRAALWAFLGAGLVVGVVYARVVTAGEGELAASTAGLRAGDPHEAAVRARRAAGWYAPGAPHVRVAYERLAALATKAEGLGDRDTALLAWRAIRTAAIETTWVVTPHEADKERADQAIARLEASVPRPPGTRTEPNGTIEREALEALARDEAPRAFWIVALGLSFVAWAGGAAWIVRRALGATGRIDLRRASPGLVATAFGVALWLLAIWRA